MKAVRKQRLWLRLSWLLLPLQGFAQEGYPPPCSTVEQVEIAPDSLKKRILFEFIRASISNKWFSSVYDKGIVHLHEYTNEEGENCWRLFPTIEDRYKDNPPTRFSDFGGDIILVYEADSVGHPLKTKGDIDSLNACLEQIIGDRVFTRPANRSRWTSDVLPIINRRRSEGNRRNITGNGGDVIIIFDKKAKGGYRKSYPA
jgi:hypothetical protein